MGERERGTCGLIVHLLSFELHQLDVEFDAELEVYFL